MLDLVALAWIVAGVATIAVLWIIRERLRRRPAICPACQQRGLVEQSKQPTGDLVVNEYGGGGFSGGQTSVRVMYKIKYKCLFCGEEVVERQTRN